MSALQAFTKGKPIKDIVEDLIKESSRVAPHHIAKLFCLFDDLLRRGLQNCAIQPRKMEGALLRIIKHDELPPNVTMQYYVLQLTDHIKFCFGFLRLVKRENLNPTGNVGHRCRRFPKTGVFRRKQTSAEAQLIDALLKHVDDSPIEESPRAIVPRLALEDRPMEDRPM